MCSSDLVVSGETSVSFLPLATALPQARQGRLRALAVSTAKRVPSLPEYPTVAEAGVPGYEFITWHGIVAPKATPQPVVNTLNEQIKKLLTAPDQAKGWQERGLDVIASTPDEFGAHLVAEQKKWGRVVKERGIKAD